jgi:thioredoxin reductase (NADPH)
MSTSIPGLYAAGDCTGGLLQIAKAVYEGAKAGTEVVKYLRRK